MHFAYPPRKSSNPPPWNPRTTTLPALPLLRRHRLKLVGIFGLAFLSLIYLFSAPTKGPAAARHVPSGKPPVVIVTVLDSSKHKLDYLEKVRANRELYAAKHGYTAFFPTISDYDLNGAPFSWTKVVALRHSLTKFPDCHYIWFLDQDALIMNPSLKVEEYIMKPSKLEKVMIKDHPVVPPDSIIKTFAHLKGTDVDFVLSQDKEGLSPGSFILRNGDWARFFLETWFDPIYRTYNFQKAETHALEHIVQWHPTILSRLALVPQDLFNGYSDGDKGAQYKEGDIVIRLSECAKTNGLECDEEQAKYDKLWRAALKVA